MLAIGDRNLRDSRVAELSADARMSLAYAAALEYAAAALAAAGYRPARGENHHFRVVQSLALTIGWDAHRVEVLDQFRKKRNVSSYERAGIVSDGEVARMHKLAEELRGDVMAWFREKHPALI